jgi:PPOX class probable F420-dependent enzyme
VSLARDVALARFAAAPVARLATASVDGLPHLVPICFVLHDGAVWSVVDEKPKPTTTGLRRLRNIAANPKVSLLADHYDDDWSRLWFVRIDGEAGLVGDGPAYDSALGRLRSKYPPYLAMRLEMRTHPMIRIAIGRVHGWSASGS